LSPHAGLAVVGKYLAHIKFDRLVDRPFAVRSDVRNSAILKSYLALLCQGKSDFDAIEAFRGDAFFARALCLEMTPSSPTLRQRLDTHALAWFELASTINEALLASRIDGRSIDFGALACGYTPLDVDTFAMNNGNTKKELVVGRTYARVDGCCPIASCLGTAGFCLELALRAGVQHSTRESEYDLQRVLPMATRLMSGPILVRADSGFCSQTAEHGTHEQFHSEFKSDMGLERLPSGKFDTNYPICPQLQGSAAVTMNLLRLMGLHTLHGRDAPIRHQAQRRRIKSVMQKMIYKSARMMRHAGRWVLGLGANDSGFTAFERHYRCLASG